jgi:hypothetical protein
MKKSRLRLNEGAADEGSHWAWFFCATGILATILALIYPGVLFVVAGVLYAVFVYQAHWFRGRIRHIYNSLILVGITIILFVLWWLLLRSSSQVQTSSENSKVFRWLLWGATFFEALPWRWIVPSGAIGALTASVIVFVVRIARKESTTGKARVDILTPLNRWNVGWHEVVRGSVFPQGSRVQVLVQRFDEHWQVQDAEVTGNAWACNCEFGEEGRSGHAYNIVAVYGNSLKLGKYDQLPEGLVKSDIVFVSRKSDEDITDCLDKQLHQTKIADKSAIRELVVICGIQYREVREGRAPARIDFAIVVLNMSLHNLSVASIDGYVNLVLDGEAYKPQMAPKLKIEEKYKRIGFRQTSYFIVRQDFETAQEAQYVLDAKEAIFQFKSLSIEVKGHDLRPISLNTDITITKKDGRWLASDAADFAFTSASKLQEIAGNDKRSIEDLVTITAIDPQPQKLTQGVPYIEFIFYIFNSSVFEISIDDSIDGYISFREGNHEDKLHQYKELKDNCAKEVSSRAEGHFRIYQRLTEDEAKHFFRSTDVWFSFTNLVITIKGAKEEDGIDEKRLDTASKLTSTTVRYLYHAPEAAIAHRKLLFLATGTEIAAENVTALKDEISSLKTQLARITGLTVEVDTKDQSDVRITPHHDMSELFRSGNARSEVDMYILDANLKLQFENHDVHRRAMKRIELSLIRAKDGTEEIVPFLSELVILLLDPDKSGEKRRFTTTDFQEQSIESLWLNFFAHVPPDAGQVLDSNYFLRVTLEALGQASVSQDLNVNWAEALTTTTYVSLRE